MANINIKTLAKPDKTSSSFTYTDLKLDLELDYTQNNEFLKRKEIKDLKIDYDYSAVKNSIFNIFTTIPGQRLLNPAFGLNLPRYLFYPVSESIAYSIGNEILAGLTQYEPRIGVQRINVAADEENQQYIITLSVIIVGIDSTSFELVGTLSNSGFFFNN